MYEWYLERKDYRKAQYYLKQFIALERVTGAILNFPPNSTIYLPVNGKPRILSQLSSGTAHQKDKERCLKKYVCDSVRLRV
jgi:hypothetical protein